MSPTITIVAAIARNGVIGEKGAMPWHLPEDLKRFKQLTLGHVLVMGRRTYDSIGRPLPGRTTIVVTRQPDWEPSVGLSPSLLRAGSIDEALRRAAELDPQVFVVGGAEIYAGALPVADALVLTWVDAEPAGDTFFPDVDFAVWEEQSREAISGGEIARYVRRRAAQPRKST